MELSQRKIYSDYKTERTAFTGYRLTGLSDLEVTR